MLPILKVAVTLDVCKRQRTIKKFLLLEGASDANINRGLVNVYGNVVLDVRTIRRWLNRAKCNTREKEKLPD